VSCLLLMDRTGVLAYVGQSRTDLDLKIIKVRTDICC
jgi:hypothetical protein